MSGYRSRLIHLVKVCLLLLSIFINQEKPLKKNNFIKFGVLILTVTLLQACGSTKAQRAVDKKLASEPAITDQQTLELKQEDTIASATGLSDEQKAKLNELRANAQAKADSIEQQSLKLREILVKNLVASNYDAKKANEVKVIKTKLVKLNHERLDLTLSSIEKAQAILGREAKNNEAMMNSFIERDYDSRGSR